MARSSQNVFQVTYPILGKDSIHLRATIIGLVAASAMLTAAISSLWLSRHHSSSLRNTSNIALSGLATMSVGFVAMSGARSLPEYVIAAMLAGAGGGLTLPSLTSLAAHSNPSNPGKGIAQYTAALSMSLLVGPVVESSVLALSGESLRTAMIVFAPWPLVGMAIIAYARSRNRIIRRPPQSRSRSRSRSRSQYGQSQPLPQSEQSQSWSQSEQSRSQSQSLSKSGQFWPQPLSRSQYGQSQPLSQPDQPSEDASLRDSGNVPEGGTPEESLSKDGTPITRNGTNPLHENPHNNPFRLPLLIQLAYQVPFIAIVSFGGLLAIHVDHTSTGEVTLLFAAFYAVSLIMRLRLAWRPPGKGSMEIVRLSLLLTVAGIAMLAVHSLPILAGGFILLGFSHGTTYPISLTLLAEGSSPEHLMRNNARLASIQSFAGVVLPAILGVSIDLLGFTPTFALILIPVIGFGIPAWRWK